MDAIFRAKSVAIAAGTAALLVCSLSAAAADDVEMSFTARDVAETGVTAAGRAARYDRIETAEIAIPLQLEASVTDGDRNRKIISAAVAFSGDPGAPTAIEPGALPSRSLDWHKTLAITLPADGATGRQAIAACNADASATSMKVPLTVRVTSGRFNFRWTDYDRVAPSAEIVANPDFYADQTETVRELEIALPLECKPLPAANVAATQPKPTANPQPASVANKPKMEEEAKEAAVQTVSIATNDPLQCEGGMIRETGSGTALCLCPGNTERKAIGTNAFACERRARRR